MTFPAPRVHFHPTPLPAAQVGVTRPPVGAETLAQTVERIVTR